MGKRNQSRDAAPNNGKRGTGRRRRTNGDPVWKQRYHPQLYVDHLVFR